MTLERIEGLLSQAIGLDPASIGAATIRSAIKSRLTACGLDDVDAYWERLCTSQDEVQGLLEAVVVSETWFLREPEAFAALVRGLRSGALAAGGERRLQILSVPCATGEEPYSIAMTLFDAGLDPSHFQIDAMDVSARAVAHAGLAMYGRNAFRGPNSNFQRKYFTQHGPCYRLNDDVRSTVQLWQGNLLTSDLGVGRRSYGAIFCRNLLIYLRRDAQELVLQILLDLLQPGGLLFVGPSETGLLLEHGFKPADTPRAFAFHAPASQCALPGATASAVTKRVDEKARPPKRRMASLPGHRHVAAVVPGADAKRDDGGQRLLAEARQLADRGAVTEAIQACQRHLREHGTSAPGFYLMGLLLDASGSSAKAKENYQRALYLDPQHEEAMVHLAALFAKEGDDSAARRMLERSRRVSARAVG